MPATYEPIATTTLGSAASSITFSSIASSWTDLRLVLAGLATADLNAHFRFNSDTGSNYSYTYVYGDGSAAASGVLSNFTRIQPYDSVYSSTPSLITLDVFSYAGSTFKTSLMTQSNDKNGSGTVSRTVGLWRSTSAITSCSITASTSTFNTGTTATLYGIKNA